jgi:glutathione synthase/RimK-type ligase-like ATP-grasp enzyme
MTAPRVLLATARELPRPVHENTLLLDALAARGVGAALVPWDGDADWEAADVVVVRTPWDYPGRAREFLAWADRVDAVTRLANPARVLRWNSHKQYLLELAEAGVPTVPTRVVRAGARTAEQRAALRGLGEVVVKPGVGSGARGALRGPAGSPAVVEHLEQLATHSDVLVQPYVPAVADGELSVLHLGGHYSHAVCKLPATGDYRVQGHHGGSVRRHEATPDERAAADRALAAVPGGDELLYARVDLVRGAPVTAENPAGLQLMELELIEPELFLGSSDGAADRYAEEIGRLLG